ncbi:McrC family protein [Litorilituus sediminis]|uniref:Restriction endonuclease n=1 Tax=Litorilituus sediminis TaxID=718192 RepID=A0A4P6PC05_9GAMM|nr:McrC family protein [Litorilituus sediminis]QBG37252.1 restriction endonuclease [Litorilituus sediminis]
MKRIQAALTVFEFGYLGVGEKAEHSKRISRISQSSFAYLKQLCLCDESESRFLSLKSIDNTEVLQLQNYAGVLFTPDGTQIEVLPKIGRKLDGEDGQARARNSLLNMLATLGSFRHIRTRSANLSKSRMPLLEVFIGQFLDSVNVLIKKGLRSDYIGRENNLSFLKGKLLISKQLKKNSINKHKFYVSHDEFVLDRPINRLIHLALTKVFTYSSSASNQKLAKELLFAFTGIPLSTNVKNDLSAVKLDRGMNYYKEPFDWAKLILEGFSPLTMTGSSYASSLLFPLETVFESYVASILATQLPQNMTLETQAKAESLVSFNKRKFFRLQPDLLITESSKRIVVLDTKWKLIDSRKDNGTDKFGLSQSDLYQMFAYGHKYLSGYGELFLIYPSHDDFIEPIEFPFEYSNELKLWIIPFDVSDNVDDNKRLIFPSNSTFQTPIKVD